MAILHDYSIARRPRSGGAIQRSPNTTYIGLVLDSSGSMYSYVGQVIAGYNLQLDTIRRRSEHDVRTWLTLFQTDVRPILEAAFVSDLFNLTHSCYRPDGGTALLDAVGQTTKSLETRDRGNPSDRFLVIVFTDGEENCSIVWREKTLSLVVKRLQATGRWTFVFVGPKGAQAQMARLGFDRENMLDFDCSRGMFEKVSTGLGKFLEARNTMGLLPPFFGDNR